MTKYEGVTKERLAKGLIGREPVYANSTVFMRQKARPILTSYSIRMQIKASVAHKEPKDRNRSLGKRLTKLDKALTDKEAYSLDRAFEAWLMTEGKSRSVDCSGSNVRGNSQSEPLNERELAQVARLRQGLKGWPKAAVERLEAGLALMAPWSPTYGLKPGKDAIRNYVLLARWLQEIYYGDYKESV